MEQQKKSSKGKEEEAAKDEAAIVKSHLQRISTVSHSGVVLDPYEFSNDNRKAGFLFHVNNPDRLTFGEGVGGNVKGCISGQNVCASFLVTEKEAQSNMEDVMRLGFSLKHIGILNPMFTAFNSQLSKNVSFFGSYDQSFRAWLTHRVGRPRPLQLYLLSDEKEILRTLTAVLYEVWNKGYTSGNFADLDSYVMVGDRIKILPTYLRLRKNHERIMPFRCAIADLIDIELRVSYWPDPELQDFTVLLRNPNAMMEDILGHPILLTPGRRQIMYRRYGAIGLSDNQQKVCKGLYDPSTMTINPLFKDDIVRAVCSKHSFSQDDEGALTFASMVSRHYVERLKKTGNWVSTLRDDTVDNALKETVPRLLSKRYGFDYVTRFFDTKVT